MTSRSKIKRHKHRHRSRTFSSRPYLRIMRSSLSLIVIFLCKSTSAFVPVATLRFQTVRTRAAKGFGGEKAKPPSQAPPKPVSKGEATRNDASASYDTQVKAGAPEFAVFARPFGSSDDAWVQVGSIACPRTERPEDMIYGNEESLLDGLFKINPKMKSEEGNLEYGFRLKKFPDDPVRVAVKKTGASKNAVMNWLGSLTSPVNTDNY